MSPSTRHVSRHASAGPLARLRAAGPRTTVKAVAGLGLVAGSLSLVIAPATSGEEAAATAQSTSTQDASAQLAQRSEDAGSRSAGREVLVAPEKSEKDSGSSDFGSVDVEAVAKPEPTPEPTPEESETSEEAQAEETEAPAEETPEATEESSAPTTQESTSSETSEETSSASEDSGSGSSGSGAPDTSSYAAEGAGIGLSSAAQRVYSAVRTEFPHLSNIGGYRAGDSGDHGSGNAVDVMCGSADGDAVAAWATSNAGPLGIKYVIWEQRIWLPGQGWRAMEDRGSATANHFDHVHISVG
ncbi:hypothetical protein GCM10027055_15410 [Janibacter alkaliphilus]|uniref:Outer membrane biosynthesis protein TonB n=1 Tax=Janibacter alkaliphilus TaxID=1069963 RepID=A0A852X4W9_9MICO|nr:hypothetical protein [Janibacter alkaliphilus]NYG37468.1 outer membrane biosynthesis protein TonB [Janibacter alkaliphilus]